MRKLIIISMFVGCGPTFYIPKEKFDPPHIDEPEVVDAGEGHE